MFKKKGFSLVSFLVYLMFFTMIMSFFCHIIVSLVIPSFSATRKCQSIIALHIASDLFVRDIKAVNNHTHWKLITPHELVWQVDEGRDIGWCFSGDRLERKEGIYTKEWKHKTTSIIAAGIKQATFTIEKHNNEIMGIELTQIPIIQAKPVNCYVAIRKGEKV